MSCNKYYRAKLILESKKQMWLRICPNLPNCAGIYILTRTDENGIRYAYVGQAKHILDRLASHLYEYPPQHIDLSLKKHKLYDEFKNPYGWEVDYFICTESELDYEERRNIYKFASLGYQLRNKTSGGQDNGKSGIAEIKASKGYYDGVDYGYKKAFKEIKEYFDKYLTYSIKNDSEVYKKDGNIKDIYIKKKHEFGELLNGGNKNGRE